MQAHALAWLMLRSCPRPHLPRAYGCGELRPTQPSSQGTQGGRTLWLPTPGRYLLLSPTPQKVTLSPDPGHKLSPD